MNFSQKSALLKLLYDTKKCQSFIETGTYEARMTLFMTSVADVIRSIELSPKLCEEARPRSVAIRRSSSSKGTATQSSRQCSLIPSSNDR